MTLADTAIVVVGAGSSIRMGFDKVWADLAGQPLLGYAIAAARAATPAEIVVVVADSQVERARRRFAGVRIVAGGARRRDSVLGGVRATGHPWVAIHDAARVLVSPDLFAMGRKAAENSGAAVPILAVKDTVKQVRDGAVERTLPRDMLATVQTPQLFRRDLLLAILEATDEDATDEATLVEQAGIRVATFPGNERNFKVTTQFDFDLVSYLVAGGGPR